MIAAGDLALYPTIGAGDIKVKVLRRFFDAWHGCDRVEVVVTGRSSKVYPRGYTFETYPGALRVRDRI